MKLHKLVLNQDGSINWDMSWKFAKPFTFENFLEANLRELYDDEIVLDFENETDGISTISLLKKENYSFKAYLTGSRGIHIHLRIPALSKLKREIITKYRELFIKKYGADISKKSGFIALENKEHFKTGKMKVLFHKNETAPNKIDNEILFKAIKLVNENREYHLKEYDNKYKVLDVAKRLGFVIVGKKGKEYFGYIEKSERKKHFWVNIEKNCFYDFHTQEGGGVISLIKRIKKCSNAEALKLLRELKWIRTKKGIGTGKK